MTERPKDLSPLKRALLAIDDLQARLRAAEQRGREPIAVVGLGCRLPGGGDDPEAFWGVLRDSVDAICEVPPDRWDVGTVFDPDPEAPGKSYTQWGGFLRGPIDRFDPQFFGIAPREAAQMDPQQRLLLEVAWEALEHAGIAPDALAGSRTGVFVGICSNDYFKLSPDFTDLSRVTAYSASGIAHSVASGRLSYVLGLHGPAVSVDTACSSSLTAIHLAVQSLRAGECRLALAGGVHLMLAPDNTILFCKSRMMSPSGRCKAFGEDADGFVLGEGCGVVVLKRLPDALVDGDWILAVIRGSAASQDGASGGLTVPHGPAQEAAIREALRDAGVAPGAVDYVEAHGTGTSLGDPIEVRALAGVFRDGREPGRPLLIGSVKTNVGHLEAAAGVTGLIKVVLALQHGQIPPHLHAERLSPHIAWGELPLTVATTARPWPRGERPRLAGVSAFGFSGTNIHLVVEEAPAAPRSAADRAERPLSVYPISARSDAGLRELARRHAAHIAANADWPLGDLVFTAGAGRAALPLRRALLVRSREQLVEQLEVLAGGECPRGAAAGEVAGTERPRVAFLFTGQGAQHVGMGRELYEAEPVFRRTLDECAALVDGQLDRPLLDVMFQDAERLGQTRYTQPALFAFEYALAALWRAWGVEPAAVLGHSLGEYVGACLAGVCELKDAVRLVAARGALMQSLPANGAMAAVLAEESRVREELAPFADRVAIAGLNAPTSVVISGAADAVREVCGRLAAAGVKSRDLAVSHAFHSPLVEPILGALRVEAAGMRFAPPRLPLVSNVTGEVTPLGQAPDADYWVRHARQPVRFQAGIQALLRRGIRDFLEIGPAPTLIGLGRQAPGAEEATWLASLRPGAVWPTVLGSLATLWTHGAPVRWAEVEAGRGRRRVSLPTYPFERRRFWFGKAEMPRRRPGGPAARHPLVGRRVRAATVEGALFEAVVRADAPPLLGDHRVHGRVVVPMAAFLEAALTAAGAAGLGDGLALRNVVLHEPVLLDDEREVTLQTMVSPGETPAGVRIYAAPAGSDDGWRLHLQAELADAEPAGPADPLEAIQARCHEPVDVGTFYAAAEDRGLGFGPRFRGIAASWRAQGEALARVEAPPSVTGDGSAFRLHPGVLDACLQTLAVAAGAAGAGASGLFMPIGVETVWLTVRPDLPLWSHARLRAGGSAETLRGEVDVYDAHGRLVGGFRGIALKRATAEQLGGVQPPTGEEDLYAVAWVPAGQQPAGTSASPTALCAGQAERLAALAATHGFAAFADVEPALDAAVDAFVVGAVEALVWSWDTGGREWSADLPGRLGVAERHRRAFGRLLARLESSGLLRRTGDAWEVCGRPGTQPDQACRDLLAQHPAFGAEIGLVARCGPRLADILRGTCEPLDLLFPDGSGAQAEDLYLRSPGARTYNDLAAEMTARLAETLGRPLRILEVGGGTGGTTAALLPRLGAACGEYLFTDVSPFFAARARERFGETPGFAAQALDLEREPATQGLAGRRFDLVVAANVLHATRDLGRTLAHVRQVLEPAGLLLLLEVTRPTGWVDVSFGLTGGWWLFDDAERQRADSPLLGAAEWLACLKAHGFDEAAALPDDPAALQTLVVARSQAQPLAPRAAGRWLILADRSGVGAGLAESLRSRGHECLLAFADTTPSEGLGALLREAAGSGQAVCGVVHLWALDEASFGAASTAGLEAETRKGTGSALELVKTLGQVGLPAAPKLWLVTRGAQPAGPAWPLSVAQSPLWGLAKVIALEHPELACTRVDLDPAAPVATAVGQLVAEVIAPETESQIAFRGGIRQVPRLARAPMRQSAVRKPERLEMGRPGVLDDLALVPLARRAPGPGEVEIEVHASGLNFRDVLNALGMRSDDQPLGGECSGRIAAVGGRVLGLAVGDAVVAVCPDCFASFVTTSAELVLPKPAGLTFEEVATIPLAFLTAQHALLQIGKLQAGERVLIHAAAGGVGLAGVQLAQRAGAEVFATAGSPAKREFLRSLGIRHVMDSRSLPFADEIAAVTGGAGVEVVLNSLTGDFIPKSLSILAPGGRFVEIGKADLWDPARVAALRPDVSYLVVDLAATLRERPASLRPQLGALLEAAARAELRPLPLQVFSVAEAPAAFRFMAQARHIGKIVLTQPVPREVAVVPDATYLITGGLAGLGLRVAGWLVERGARHLVLMGRRPPAETARAVLRGLEEAGARVVVAQGDVAQEARVGEVLADIASGGPPLRGVIHAAGVLDDGVLVQQTWERFARVLAPKVAGAWNLHRLTQGLPLDFFILFSSAAALLGSPGQGNHAAANAFLDALAHHRRALGLPATSINWGVWSEVGAAAERGIEERAGLQGMGSFTPEQGLGFLEQILAANPVQLGVMAVNWARLVKAVGIESPFLSGVAARERSAATVEQPTGRVTARQLEVRKQIEEAPIKGRRRLLLAYVRTRAAKVLGLHPTEEVDVRRPLNEMGLDSLMAVELRTVLGAGLGLLKSLPATLVFDHPSIMELADYLGRDALHLEITDAQPEPEHAEEGIGGVLNRIEQLSEDEVERLFRGGAPGNER